MAKALIVFSTKSGETELIGEFIAKGLQASDVETDMLDAHNIKNESEIKGYDALVFGSAVYFGEMLQDMKDFLFIAKKAGLEGKVGGSFGAFAWSEEVVDLIYKTMKNIFKMDMASGPLRIKTCRSSSGRRMAHDYGREIAMKLGG